MKFSDLWNSIILCTHLLVLNSHSLKKKKKCIFFSSLHCESFHTGKCKLFSLLGLRTKIADLHSGDAFPFLIFLFYWGQWEGGDSGQCLHTLGRGEDGVLRESQNCPQDSNRWCCGPVLQGCAGLTDRVLVPKERYTVVSSTC